jgi:hypothetical protein
MSDLSAPARPARRAPLGSAAVFLVLVVAGALLYHTTLRDGDAAELLASLIPSPQPVEAAIDVTEPLGVDLSSIQGFEDWQYVSDLDAKFHAEDGKLFLEAIIPPVRAGGGHRGSAVIGGRIIRPGDSVAGYRLVLIRDKHVLLQKGEKLIALRLKADPPAKPTRS